MAAPVTLSPADAPYGWEQTNHAAALEAFRRSCTSHKRIPAYLQKVISEAAWKKTCTDAAQVGDAKSFFENRFTFYRLSAEDAGLLTGYFIPEFHASLTRDAQHSVPVYAPPPAEMMHLSRAEIDGGAIDGKTKVIAWMASAVDRFFLQIQGSGFIRLPDGQRKKLQFAAKTTQPYTPVGRVLIERGEVAKEDMSMQAIRHWLETHPDQAEALMQENASYVFFSLEDAAEIPSGSHGVPLTPGQSLAVDTDMLPLGLPVFIDTQLYNAQRFAHLMIMQDTGSAIKGPLRGDIFFGSGDKAAELAGHQQAPGSWTLLVPKP